MYNENDWLDAIIALPEQMFYNTGIATFIIDKQKIVFPSFISKISDSLSACFNLNKSTVFLLSVLIPMSHTLNFNLNSLKNSALFIVLEFISLPFKIIGLIFPVSPFEK